MHDEQQQPAGPNVYPDLAPSNPTKFTFCPHCGFSLIEQKQQDYCESCGRRFNEIQMAVLPPSSEVPAQAATGMPFRPSNNNVQPMQPTNVLVDQNQQALTAVPGSQEIGLTLGTKCAYCGALAVSKCNFKEESCFLMGQAFIGCDKPFCRECGIPHFYSNMINQDRIGSYENDPDLDEATKRLVQQANIDRANIPHRVAMFRVCKECTGDLKQFKKRERQKSCGCFSFVLVVMILIIALEWFVEFDDDDGRRRGRSMPRVFPLITEEPSVMGLSYDETKPIEETAEFKRYALQIVDKEKAKKVKMDKAGLIHDQYKYHAVLDVYKNGQVTVVVYEQYKEAYEKIPKGSTNQFRLNKGGSITLQSKPESAIGLDSTGKNIMMVNRDEDDKKLEFDIPRGKGRGRGRGGDRDDDDSDSDEDDD